jgi:hypothetical protein
MALATHAGRVRTFFGRPPTLAEAFTGLAIALIVFAVGLVVVCHVAAATPNDPIRPESTKLGFKGEDLVGPLALSLVGLLCLLAACLPRRLVTAITQSDQSQTRTGACMALAWTVLLTSVAIEHAHWVSGVFASHSCGPS